MGSTRDAKWRITYEKDGVQGCWQCGAEYAIDGEKGPVCPGCGEQLSMAEVEPLED